MIYLFFFKKSTFMDYF